MQLLRLTNEHKGHIWSHSQDKVREEHCESPHWAHVIFDTNTWLSLKGGVAGLLMKLGWGGSKEIGGSSMIKKPLLPGHAHHPMAHEMCSCLTDVRVE